MEEEHLFEVVGNLITSCNLQLGLEYFSNFVDRMLTNYNHNPGALESSDANSDPKPV
jgi:hypothetical protein